MSESTYVEATGPARAPAAHDFSPEPETSSAVARLRALASTGSVDASSVADLCASAPEHHDELFAVIHATPGWGNAFAQQVLGAMHGADDEVPWNAVNDIVASDPAARAEYDEIAAAHDPDAAKAVDEEHEVKGEHEPDKTDKAPAAGTKLKPFAGKWNVYYGGKKIGEIIRNTYAPYSDGTNSGLTIDLDFKADAKAAKTLADFAAIRWVQVIYTNDASSSAVAGKAARYVDPESPDEKTTDDVEPFYHTATEEKDNETKAGDGLDTNFWDQPSRPRTDATAATPKVWWNAELALTGVLKSGKMVYLRSLEYGFDIDYNAAGPATLKRNSLRGRKKPSKEFKETVKAFIKKHKGTKGTKP